MCTDRFCRGPCRLPLIATDVITVLRSPSVAQALLFKRLVARHCSGGGAAAPEWPVRPAPFLSVIADQRFPVGAEFSIQHQPVVREPAHIAFTQEVANGICS